MGGAVAAAEAGVLYRPEPSEEHDGVLDALDVLYVNTLRSILVAEETDEYISLRAASEKGTVASALNLWWVCWRRGRLPHRWYQYDDDGFDERFPDRPTRKGWSWGNRQFWVRELS